MIVVYFRSDPEDVFADGFPFGDLESAREWFNPQFKAWQDAGHQIIKHTAEDWPCSGDIVPVWSGTFLKGFSVQPQRDIGFWVIITDEHQHNEKTTGA